MYVCMYVCMYVYIANFWVVFPTVFPELAFVHGIEVTHIGRVEFAFLGDYPDSFPDSNSNTTECSWRSSITGVDAEHQSCPQRSNM